ncbi:MAG: VWA domain-containing protein, partial [Oscillospiraceae bacterium]|nr:VWA domain-containing protein [Oscillospiraceae bacterium]
MKTSQYSRPKRILAMLLSAVLILSMLPAMGSAAAIPAAELNKTADESTMDSWKTLFSNTDVSTELAGGIWTDKSVFTDADAFRGTGITLEEDHFLVALSALAANSTVSGKSANPADTIFVLDISGSMENSELNAMVAAANDAIRTLLGSNPENRMGIVLYSDDAHVLLPLGRYTGVEDSSGVRQYIRRGRNSMGGWPDYQDNNYITTVPGLTTESGAPVYANVKLGGGTYIQGGLWKAWEQFSAVTDTAGRTPIMVLMSDGAPTFVTNDYSDVPDTYEYGRGSSSLDGDGFVTQLTAACVKAMMAEKYGQTAYFYTLGLGVDSVDNSEIAKAVLNPGKNTTDAIDAYWETFDSLSDGQTMNVILGKRPGKHDSSTGTTQSVAYSAAAAGQQTEYVDKYFAAADSKQLSAVFRNILHEINLKAGYYPTRLDEDAPNCGGYVTFADEIGMGMEVKQIEGILMGSTLYSGAVLAKAMAEGEFTDTELGDNLVGAVQKRLGIRDTQTVRDLLARAWNAGQLRYTGEAAWSSYIGWYGSADGEYLGFWSEDDTEAPEGAVYANKCYLLLGSTTDAQTTYASDMMYIAIQVFTQIETGNQTVFFRIPASLLPVVTYRVTIDTDHPDDTGKMSLEYGAADPIRLVYEVGIRGDITPWNIADILPEGYPVNEDGTYTLYTNHWYAETESEYANPSDDTAKNAFPYACFEPSEENEHYYFTEDTYILDADGSRVKSVADGAACYQERRIYKLVNGAVQVEDRLEALSAGTAALSTADADGYLYIPKGTMRPGHQTHDLYKTEVGKGQNDTGTLSFVRCHRTEAAASGDESRRRELVYLGNNGALTCTPAQGIKLSKVMKDGSAPDTAFTFDIQLADTAFADTLKTIRTAADGTVTEGSVTFAAGKAALQLKAGGSVCILGVPVGSYTVTEREDGVYQAVGGSSAAGRVRRNRIDEITFTNEKIVYGSLTVTKSVRYVNVAEPETNQQNFTVRVTLRKGGEPYANKRVGGYTTDANGVLTLTIRDKGSVTVGNIPVGVTYTVAETDLPSGYTWENGTDAGLKGTIRSAGNTAALRNRYQAAPVTAASLTGTKTLTGREMAEGEFSFVLKDAGGNVIETVKNGADGKFAFTAITYAEAGTYTYTVSEVKGNLGGVAYDKTVYTVVVTVTDGGNGKLAAACTVNGGADTRITFA